MLLEELKKSLSPDSEIYKKNLEITTKEFFEYCQPGSMNNWQHPEKPPVVAGMMSVYDVLMPSRVLDLGSGFTSLIFRKFFKNSKIVSVDSSYLWATRLFKKLNSLELDATDIYKFKEGYLVDVSGLSPLVIQALTTNILSEESYSNFYIGEIETLNYASILNLPNDQRDLAMTMFNNEQDYFKKLDYVSTRCNSYCMMHGKLLQINENKVNLSNLGKFDFVHYDLGGMFERRSFLEVAIKMLDRSKESILYVDDMHKKDDFFGKKYGEIVLDDTKKFGGELITTLKDHQGGAGSFFYFPPDSNF